MVISQGSYDKKLGLKSFVISQEPLFKNLNVKFQKVVEELIRHGVDVHKTLHNAKNKESPLMMACNQGNLDMVKLLIKHKARVEEKGMFHILINF